MFSTLLWYLEDKNEYNRNSCINLNGELVECERIDGRLCAKRLLSTNPASYLDTRYSPGRIIEKKSKTDR